MINYIDSHVASASFSFSGQLTAPLTYNEARSRPTDYLQLGNPGFKVISDCAISNTIRQKMLLRPRQ